jgi:hypothetical protein
MTDTIFDIVGKTPLSNAKKRANFNSAYNSLLQSYLTQIYSTSTEAFIKKIACKTQA